jgi:hypothetical protein
MKAVKGVAGQLMVAKVILGFLTPGTLVLLTAWFMSVVLNGAWVGLHLRLAKVALGPLIMMALLGVTPAKARCRVTGFLALRFIQTGKEL